MQSIPRPLQLQRARALPPEPGRPCFDGLTGRLDGPKKPSGSSARQPASRKRGRKMRVRRRGRLDRHWLRWFPGSGACYCYICAFISEGQRMRVAAITAPKGQHRRQRPRSEDHWQRGSAVSRRLHLEGFPGGPRSFLACLRVASDLHACLPSSLYSPGLHLFLVREHPVRLGRGAGCDPAGHGCAVSWAGFAASGEEVVQPIRSRR